MATLVIPGAYQVSLHHEVSSQEVVNVLGFTDGGLGGAQELADLVHSTWTNAAGPIKMLPSVVKLTRIKVTALGSTLGETYEKSMSNAGLATGALGSLASCAVVRVGAGTRSRSGKGRVYFGPINTGTINADGRTIAAGSQTALQASFEYFKTTMETGGYPWVVLSRKLLSTTPIDSISVAAVLGTQRRRLR